MAWLGYKTDRTTLLTLLTQHGFQNHAPEQLTDKPPLQQALRAWIRLRGATQRNAGVDDETATRADSADQQTAGQIRGVCDCRHTQRWQLAGGYLHAS
jgi:hypothetical protein